MRHSSIDHKFRSSPGESGTAEEVKEEEETPAASLTAVEEGGGDDDADTLAWEGFMSPVMDSSSLDVLTVVVEETEIEAHLRFVLEVGVVVATVIVERRKGR